MEDRFIECVPAGRGELCGWFRRSSDRIVALCCTVLGDSQRPEIAADGDAAGALDEGTYVGRVRFEVLGRLRVVDGRDWSAEDAAGLHLGGARQQVVLAMLLAAPNSVVSTDALVDGLWGDSPPGAARHTVQGYVSELRKLLGPVIEREGPGYVVRVDSSSLDSLEFEELVRSGSSRAGRRSARGCGDIGPGPAAVAGPAVRRAR